CGLSSTLSFTILILSECSVAISSRMGETRRHGPHHSAQKSTMIGVLEARTSSAKVSSVTSCAADMWLSPAVFGICWVWLALRGDRDHALGGTARGREPALGLGEHVLRQRREVVLGVERGDRARAGRGDGLAVGGVDHVTGGEHALD